MSQLSNTSHEVIVLFYKYFVEDKVSYQATKDLLSFLETLTKKLCMKGRVLLAEEGINGTLSAPTMNEMKSFIHEMETYQVSPSIALFTDVDWKLSSIDHHVSQSQPFPDLKLSLVKEIVSTGGVITVDEIEKFGGKHLSPEEFHQCLLDAWSDDTPVELDDRGTKRKEVVVIDVRNTFEHAIGNFQTEKRRSMNPKMVTFSEFDAKFCAEQSEYLKDKKVMMYCTGGIRCEKASAMLRKRGVEDVNQLSGGIHRYLERFPDGFFRGKNFVFDQRVTQTVNCEKGNNDIVGKCTNCCREYDELSGSRICTVCRDLVLVCPECVKLLREFHCEKHAAWKDFYFTFLEVFNEDELQMQKEGLTKIRESIDGHQKNTRRTLMKQIRKIDERMHLLESCEAKVDRNAPRRCRTCRESSENCDGCCWGFWKKHHKIELTHHILPINVGDMVSPGVDWNETRFGSKPDVVGRVVEIKAWSSGGPNDCVRVEWLAENMKPNIYRWGHRNKSGKICYDLVRK